MAQVNFTERPNIVAVYDVWAESQNVATNQSVVRRQLRVVEVAQQASHHGDALGFSSSVAGVPGNGSWSYDFRPGGMQSYWLVNDTVTVTHNADGTMAVWCEAWINGDVLGVAPFGFTVTLPTIPRATTPTLPGPATSNVAIAISLTGRASTAFTHTLKYNFYGATGTIATATTATSVNWTPPDSLIAKIPNDTSGVGTLTCETYNGATLIGTRDIPFTLKANDNLKPTITAPTLTDMNTAVATAIGGYVQGESLIRAVANGAGIQGSTIQGKAFVFEGSSVASGQSVLATINGSRPLTSSVTDSRGRSATRTDNLTILAYAPPKVNSMQVRRCTATGVLDNMGEYLRLDLNASVTSLKPSTVEKNSMTIKVETKPMSASSYTARNTITAALSYNTFVVISGGAAFAQGTSYDVQVSVTDKVRTVPVPQKTIVSTAVVALHLGTGVGVGKLWEQGGADVAGAIYSDGSKVITEAAWPQGFVPIPPNYALYKPSLGAPSYPMGISNVFVEPDAGWPIGGAYGNVMTVRAYNQSGGTIQYWSVYQAPTATTFTDVVFYRQWFYNTTSWSPWKPLSNPEGGTAVRNLVYPLPTTDAARVALANRKVKWFNNDTDNWEMYYATTGLSGLTARGLLAGQPSGWYPMAGSLMTCTRIKNNSFQPINANVLTKPIMITPALTNVGGFTLPGSGIAPPIGGYYDILGNVYWSGGGAMVYGICALSYVTGGVEVTTTRVTIGAADMQTEVNAKAVPLTTGQGVELVALTSGNTNMYGDGVNRRTHIAMSYVGPPFVN